MSELVCVIPARAGSRRLPGKNTAAFHGRPLGDWTFAFATGLGVFDRIVLTTDDEPLAALMPLGIARLARPPALASDTATLLEVLRHVIADLPVDAGATVVLMPVTGPLRTRGDFHARPGGLRAPRATTHHRHRLPEPAPAAPAVDDGRRRHARPRPGPVGARHPQAVLPRHVLLE